MKPLATRAFVAACLCFVLGLAACGGSKPATDSGTSGTGATAAPAQALATKAPAGAAATQAPAARATLAPTAEPTEEPLAVSDRAQGLDQLKSYRARWKSEWNGTEGDKQVTVTWDWIEEYTSEPQALHFVFNTFSSAEPDKQGIFEVWQLGDASYMMTGKAGEEQQCIMMASEDNQFERGLFNPSSLGAVQDARYVGMDTINGVRARHYKYDEKSASLAGFSRASGEIWVAVDGGFVVKDVLNWEGGFGFLGSSLAGSDKGKGQWTWELSDVNRSFIIESPANCESAAGDLPIMDGATEKSTFGDMITYKTASSIGEAVEFYQQAMPAAGWQEAGEPMITESFASLSFSKDGQTAQIMVTSENNQTQVLISVQK